LWPIFPIVMASRVLHAAASCVLGPAIAAISLGLVGHAELGERIGRNARFASIGAGLSAAAMGAAGHYLSNQSVFLVTAALVVPTLLALSQIRMNEAGLHRLGAGLERKPQAPAPPSGELLGHRPPAILSR